MYLQPSTKTFITVEAYIAAPLLLITALLLHAASMLIKQPDSSGAASQLPKAQHEGPIARFQAKLGGRAANSNTEDRMCPAGSVEPLRLRVSLQQFGGACCVVVLLHAACAALGVVTAALTQQHTASTVSAPTAVSGALVLAGLCAAAWPQSTQSATPTSKKRGTDAVVPADRDQDSCNTVNTQEAGDEHTNMLAQWQAIKAVALLGTGVLMAGSLFVNWCVSPPRHTSCSSFTPR